MLVVFPSHYGMCFGVKDALTAVEQLDQPSDTTIWGELVHNPDVNSRLREQGFHLQNETQRAGLPQTRAVVVTAHGLSQRETERMRQAGLEIHDTTCPLVRRVHRSASHFHGRGYHVVVVGKPDHVEVLGIVGDLEHFSVFARVQDVHPIDAEKLVVLSQTTTPPALFQEVASQVKTLHPQLEVKVLDTVCQPTRDRQRAMEEMLPRVEAVVVVGGKSSNNTLRLCQLARSQGKPCHHVERAEELRPEWFVGVKIVGLAAGTSTPDDHIEAVHRRLLQLGRVRRLKPAGRAERGARALPSGSLPGPKAHPIGSP